MIVTFTANPSLDKTIVLAEPLSRGEVHRAVSAGSEAGGKGINVARCVSYAGVEVVPVLSFRDEAFQPLVAAAGVAAAARTVDGPYRVRTNTTLTEPDGTTTKVNEPGPTLTPAQVDAATALLLDTARGADWVVLSGSLPPGAPADWYARLTGELTPLGCKVAIDTSDAALDAVLAALPGCPFDLIKPNSDELAQLTGGDAAAFEASAEAGDLSAIVEAGRVLHDRGIANVLVTLGGSGAVLVNEAGAWYATAPRITVQSTVGAGDSSVAGFVLAEVAGESPDRCLANAAAYGSAAAGLPGTSLPHPDVVHPEQAHVTRLA